MNVTRRKVQILIELADTVEEANNVIDKYYHFKTVAEKIAFLKGLFDIEFIGKQCETEDENAYNSMLTEIIKEKIKR